MTQGVHQKDYAKKKYRTKALLTEGASNLGFFQQKFQNSKLLEHQRILCQEEV